MTRVNITAILRDAELREMLRKNLERSLSRLDNIKTRERYIVSAPEPQKEDPNAQ